MKTTTQKGFTLVELAIVMTIIGLLIGGILKGQELMQTARVTTTVSQVKAFEAAVTSFSDSFNALPGDMPAAANRISGCNAGCNNTAATAGNGIVGQVAWAGGGYAVQGGVTSGTVAAAADTAETWQFWTHLLLANLISGVTDQSIRAGTNYQWDVTHPSADIGGGYIVGNASGALLPGAPTGATANTGPVGLVLALVQTPAGVGGVVGQTAGTHPLSPARAAQIDRKMDDGRPAIGYVQSFGVAPSASPATTPGSTGCNLNDGSQAYNEAVTVESCGLVFRIQG